MPIQQVSFQNNSITKQNPQQQNVAISPTVTKSTGDTVEISTKKKENKVLKYTLIGVGALLCIVAIVKHKSIAKIFERTPEIKPEVNPTPIETPKPTGTTSHHSTSSGGSSYTQVPSAKTEPSSVPSTNKNKTETSTPTVEVKNKVDIVQNAPSPLVQIEKVFKESEVDDSFLQKSKDKNYQLWHFTSPKFFQKFIEMHPDLADFCKKANLHCNNIISLKEKINDVSRPTRENYKKLAQQIKEKSGVDLLGEFKHYRFISQRELDAIKTNNIIKDKSGKYVTLCPDYGLSCDTFDYRITFKNTERIKKADNYIHDKQYKTVIDNGYSPSDIERVEKLVDGKWQEVDFSPRDTHPQKISSQKTENAAPLVSHIKKLSDMEVRSLVSKSLDTEHKYKLSDSERAIIQNKYGSYSQEYIKNLCSPIDEDGIKFMTKLANVCDGKYAEYWKSNPDKLILITNGGTLRNKIDINASEHEWDIIINSFKTFFSDKTDMHNLKAVMDYKQCLFEKINCVLTNRSEMSNILKSIEGKESLNSDEIKKIKSTLNYLKGLTGYQMPGITANLIPQFDSKFDNIIKHLDTGKLNRSKINQIKTELLNLQSDILNYRKEDNVQGVADFLTNLIEKHGESLENVKLNRYERSIENSILSTIEIDGHSLTDLMKQATNSNDNSIITRICNHLNTEQPSLERGSFMSTSLSPFKIIDEHPPIQWTLKSNKDVKGLYIEDLYNVLYGRGNKDGNEVELLVQRGSKIKIKKAEFKNGVWQLEGVISPSTVAV